MNRPGSSPGSSKEEFLHLDLFSGLQGWRTHRELAYVGIDNDPQFDNTITQDIRTVTLTQIIDSFGSHWGKHKLLITTSPVCTGFTVMQIGRNWTKSKETGWLFPKTETAELGLELMVCSIGIVNAIECTYPNEVYWIMENPRAAMRKMPHLATYPRRTVTYCQYPKGRVLNTMKPTDLWLCDYLERNSRLWWKEPCKKGSPCHIAAPRGSYTGTQGMTKAEAAKIPADLADAVVSAIL